MLVNPTGIPKTGGEVSGLLTLLAGLANTGPIAHTGTTQFTTVGLTLANGNNNNIALPANATNISYSGPTGAHAITGIAGGAEGQVLIIQGNTTQTLTLANNSASSDDANKIITATGGDIAVGGQAVVSLVYRGSRWRVRSARGSAGVF
jgi:hypothetical protein